MTMKTYYEFSEYKKPTRSDRSGQPILLVLDYRDGHSS
jgi:hypothetical protein